MKTAATESNNTPRHQEAQDDISDDGIWKKTDEEILRLQLLKWCAPGYSHFDILVQRIPADNNKPKKLRFKLTCKYDPVNHLPIFKDRVGSGKDGTTNMNRSIEKCEIRRGVKTNSHAARLQSGYNMAALELIWANGCCPGNRRPSTSPSYSSSVTLLLYFLDVPPMQWLRQAFYRNWLSQST
ncbi:hypothetical protein CPB83DRAFT_841118 [Crepidotus variabilis]|uniref:Uncharacterized protein n=1 Tax=Crepidotus variabilis TaxID=179855 RepID=A0A9P6JHZ7_9AGAR|nr:hypothetical protein CPB83DRAFT_841118 [Crepidotus variabilis]